MKKRTISGMTGAGSLAHNRRDFIAENVNPNRVYLNICYRDENLKDVYKELFDESVERYNVGKRNDRKITNYYDKIQHGKQEKLFHEVIFQIGNNKDMAAGTPEGDLAVKVLNEYMQDFQRRNPTLRVFCCYLHQDEATPHAILLTREKTLPNISALMNTLMETDAKERVSKELLLEAIDDFEKDNIDSRECISEWKSKVAAETEMITKKALKKILNMRTGIASKFNRFLHEKYGVWIDGELRKGEFEATYQIGNLLNIKYEYNEKDYLDGRTFVYYVGAKSKRLAYPNACCMRKVISLGEELEYEEALPLMAVEFVRNSQYTVLPFPFKYLREYIKQC